MSTHRKRPLGRVCLMALALAALFLLSFVWGRYDVPLGEVVRILLSRLFPLTQTWTDNMAIAVHNVRLPRILMACLVGCALSAAGASYQTVFQNPMAAPDILGASSGACFGAALAILLGQGSVMTTIFAFCFSLLTVVLVYLIGSRTRGSRVVSILLAGIMVGSLFSAGTSYIKLVADPANQLPQITYWLMGSLSGTRLKTVGFAAACMAVGLVPLLLLRWRMNLLTLSPDEARSMGVNTDRIRLAVILCATVLTAASVSVSGMIGWVGLVIPHLSRRIVGNDCRYLLPMSMVFGAGFLLLVDDLARCLTAVEIPIGILTAFVGAPFFVYLMVKGGTACEADCKGAYLYISRWPYGAAEHLFRGPAGRAFVGAGPQRRGEKYPVPLHSGRSAGLWRCHPAGRAGYPYFGPAGAGRPHRLHPPDTPPYLWLFRAGHGADGPDPPALAVPLPLRPAGAAGFGHSGAVGRSASDLP